MPTLAQLYEDHAEECIRSAAREDDPKRRDMLHKLASAWREDAEALKRGEDLHKLASSRRKHSEGAPSDAPAPARRIKR
jgi:hypothetical protein